MQLLEEAVLPLAHKEGNYGIRLQLIDVLYGDGEALLLQRHVLGRHDLPAQPLNAMLCVLAGKDAVVVVRGQDVESPPGLPHKMLNCRIQVLLGHAGKGEGVVVGVLVGVFGVLDFEGMTKLAGYSFLAFNLLCAPCFAAIGAIKREMNSPKWTWFAIGYQCGFAYAVSLIIYQLGCLFTGNVHIIGLIFALALVGLFIYLLVRPYKEATRFDKNVKIGKSRANA